MKKLPTKPKSYNKEQGFKSSGQRDKRKRLNKIPNLVMNAQKHTLVVLFMFFSFQLFSQDISTLPITLPTTDISVEDAIVLIKQQQNIVFSYNNNLLANKKLHFNKTKLTIAEILKVISSEANVDYKIRVNKVMLFTRGKKITVRGNLNDGETHEPLAGAIIKAIHSHKGAMADNMGSYSISFDYGAETQLQF